MSAEGYSQDTPATQHVEAWEVMEEAPVRRLGKGASETGGKPGMAQRSQENEVLLGGQESKGQRTGHRLCVPLGLDDSDKSCFCG